MKLREEIRKDNSNKNRVFNIYICDTCDVEYSKQKRLSEGAQREHYCSSTCYKNREIDSAFITVKCAHCSNDVVKRRSDLSKSKSGLHFCNRECKEEGQKYIKEIQPDHYGSAGGYRRKAFAYYPHECEECKFNIIEALEVHHIDKNTDNDNIENLVILCCNCHTLIHHGAKVLSRARLICTQ